MKYLEKFRLDKKIAFILGGSGLIGSEIVKATLDSLAFQTLDLIQEV